MAGAIRARVQSMRRASRRRWVIGVVAVAVVLAAAWSGAIALFTRAPGPLRARDFALLGGSTYGFDEVLEGGIGIPLGRTLTINLAAVADTGRRSAVLLDVRPAASIPGLSFTGADVVQGPAIFTVAPGASLGTPAVALSPGQPELARVRPLRGFVVPADPRARYGADSPTLAVTARATRRGVYALGDWIVDYRVGSARYTLQLEENATFCAGIRTCPDLGPP